MGYMKVNGKCYEVLEKGDLYGNISHVKTYWDVWAEVIHSGKDSGGNLYVVVKYLDDGGVEMFWEKDLHDQGDLPLKLLDEDCEVEEVTEPDFISARVVGVREYDDDYSIVEMKVPSFVAVYLLTLKELEIALDEGDCE